MANSVSTLFLKQSYHDNWESYLKSIKRSDYPLWDYIILTASNEDQADAYRQQIEHRLSQGLLPSKTSYAVIPDPDGKRVGSGGATLNVMKYVYEQCGCTPECFFGKKILVIHSGGDSKRVPQYSACGKLFSPVQHELLNGRPSSLFDEFIVAMSSVPPRMNDGIVVMSGDVLLLFNSLQIDFSGSGAVISIKEDVNTGKNHGVFLGDKNGYVGSFLHKQSVETLTRLGAVNEQGNVNIDTGAVWFSGKLVHALFSLMLTDGKLDSGKFDKYVNELVRLSFYGDFLYPLASGSTLENYLKEAPEGEFSDELSQCRKDVWGAISDYRLKLFSLSPARFIHFGTTGELLQLMVEKIPEYSFLGWENHVCSTAKNDTGYSTSGSYIEKDVTTGKNTFIENSYLLCGSTVGSGCVISNVTIDAETPIPDDIVLHCIKQKNGKFVARIYGTGDNPKNSLNNGGTIFAKALSEFLSENSLSESDIWDGDDKSLWKANIYNMCDTVKDAVKYALNLYDMINGKGDRQMFLSLDRTNLCDSFNNADVGELLSWQAKLYERVIAYRFVRMTEEMATLEEVKKVFSAIPLTNRQVEIIKQYAEKADFSHRMRMLYYLSEIMTGKISEELENECFRYLESAILSVSEKEIEYNEKLKICKDSVTVELPVRINFGGGWSDTPPYCNENSSTVLNAAIKLDGKFPVTATASRLDRPVIAFESEDAESYTEFTELSQLTDDHNPFDYYSIHKAALRVCGVIPADAKDITLDDILKRLGGGFKLSTKVINIPRGSGLGTSSILAGACVKALHGFFGLPCDSDTAIDKVLIMEQMMSTGGGWQDQVGGIVNGIKLLSSKKGLRQQIKIEPVELDEEILKELQERFIIIYTGQRRLARNLLRNVVKGYLSGDKEISEVLSDIQSKAVLMAYELKRGNIDGFAHLLTEHLELSKKLDRGAVNTCIDHIFIALDDMLEGKMICGAGGGGFLQAVLKKGITPEMAQERIKSLFQDSGVELWSFQFV